MIEFVLDSYAIIEFLKGNQKFGKYVDVGKSVTTKLQMAEVYFNVLRDFGELMAEYDYDSLVGLDYPLYDETIKSAMKKRMELKKAGKDISYADAIGYQLALDLKAKFVTGDNEFRDLENVIFIK